VLFTTERALVRERADLCHPSDILPIRPFSRGTTPIRL
jgi:hypothetical protein